MSKGGNDGGDQVLKKILTGNMAVAHGVMLSRVEVIAAYPITPQTPIVEKLSEWVAEGNLSARFIHVESEHSAMASAAAASVAGARTFTATSSQGIALMHEVLHWASGTRLPIVMANVNRALGAPWNIWNDQSDSLAQRDTGWIQFYCETNQECLDSVIQAYKIAENLSLPVMIVLDGFFLSHTEEPVDIPDQEAVDQFLPPREAIVKLDPQCPHVFNIIAPPHAFSEMKQDGQRAMDRVSLVAEEVNWEFRKSFNRGYDLVEMEGPEDPDLVLITMGALASTIREVLIELQREEKKIGLMKIRMFRPFPSERIKGMLQRTKKIAVIDRGFAIGTGGILSHELKAALFGMDPPPLLYQFISSIGGMDVTPDMVRQLIDRSLGSDDGIKEPIWIGVDQ